LILAAVDVHYFPRGGAAAAAVLFQRWDDAKAADVRVARIAKVEPYAAGEFYLRELPCLAAVLNEVKEPLAGVVVDGYVWLGDARPGLGARLFDAIGVPVIGVAKSRFQGAPAIEVLRGQSKRPLFVTAAGMRTEEAADRIKHMHGAHRVPTLLAAADRACRDVL
jgi:deoxyribonuclease V